MRREFLLSSVALVALAISTSVLAGGCGGAAPAAPTAAPAPASAPTAAPPQAPAAPAAKPAEPTKAPAAAPAVAPTAAPQPAAKKVDYPQKGRTVTLIVPAAAGGAGDLNMRMMQPFLEKELGATIQVVDKPGAGQQVGIAELAQSKPDGYTLAQMSQPHILAVYLDPDRKATFGRKDLQPLANYISDPLAVAVTKDSPFKTMKDIIDTAKANPEKVKVSTTGVLSPQHLALLALQKQTGVSFAIVHFDGGAPALTALMGGHVDVMPDVTGVLLPQVKGGQLRILGVMDKKESSFFPGIPTLESQGYKVYMTSARSIITPAGTPKEIVDILAGALKKILNSDELKKSFADAGQPITYLSPEDTLASWTEAEAMYGPMIEEGKKQQK